LPFQPRHPPKHSRFAAANSSLNPAVSSSLRQHLLCGFGSMSHSSPSAATPTAASSSASSSASPAAGRTPTAVPLIAVQSQDLVKLHQHVFQEICQNYLDSQAWTPAQQRVLSEVFNKFSHNVFATVRKNVTLSTKDMAAQARRLQPLDRQLAADVEALDAQLDATTARVEALRKEVPRLLNELVERQASEAAAAGTKAVAAAEEVAPSDSSSSADLEPVGSVLSHVADEIRALSRDFEEVRQGVSVAVEGCHSAVTVVTEALSKPESTTQKVRAWSGQSVEAVIGGVDWWSWSRWWDTARGLSEHSAAAQFVHC
jgi:hypothetical protein